MNDLHFYPSAHWFITPSLSFALWNFLLSRAPISLHCDTRQMWSFCSSVNHGCGSLSVWNSQRKDEEGVVGKKKKCLSSCLFHLGQQLKYELQLSKWIHKTYPNISHLMGVCLLTWHSALPLFSISRNGCGKFFKKWTTTTGKMEQHSLVFFLFVFFKEV